VRYVSTRGTAPKLAFDDVLLSGLARDGGLYVPAGWPRFTDRDMRALRGLSYADLAFEIVQPFIGSTIEAEALSTMLRETYAGFDHAAVAPLKQLAPEHWLMELFHGPTIAFKDYALQLVGRLFDHVLSKRGERITIVGATSGDTGSAAIEACRGSDAVDIFILHPKGRVSEVQRRQMTTVEAPNVFNIAVEGTFDDCQDLVKALFADQSFRDRVNLSAVNSINWARVMAQIVYYAHAAIALGAPDREISFAVPTGNFGNVFAGYAARQMGFPIRQLIVGTNTNDILHRFLESGEMAIEGVEPTLSPSMDIQVSSNFERLLFDLYDRDGPRLAEEMTAFRRTGRFSVTDNQLGEARALFTSFRLDDEGTVVEIARVHRETGEVVDPHTAIGIAAARHARQAHRCARVPVVSLGTAHPAKFAQAVERAVGFSPALPPHLASLMQAPERLVDLPNDLAALQAYVLAHARRVDRAA